MNAVRAWLTAEFACLLLLPAPANALLAAGPAGQDAQPVGLFAFVLAFATLLAMVSTALAVRLRAGGGGGGLERVRAGVFRALAALLAFLPLRDPDAKGRPRPRAPGVAVLATA